MRSSMLACLAIPCALSLAASTASAQLAIQLGSAPAVTDFNSIAVSGSSNTTSTLPIGWIFSEAGGNITYAAGDGSSSVGNTYSFGTGTNTERALGEVTSSVLQSTIGAAFLNNTGFALPKISIAYTGEEWRLGDAAAPIDRLDFQYSTNATSLLNGTWTNLDSLDFSSPNNAAGSTGALNGNSAGNRTQFAPTTIAFTPSLAQGAVFFIRWVPLNIAGNNDGLAIDDVTIQTRVGWDLPSGGDWFVAGNWAEGVVPNGVGAVGVLAHAITASHTVYADQNLTLGRLRFDNASTYNLSGAASLSMDVSSGAASIEVVQGEQKINLPLILADDTTAAVGSGAQLTIADPMTINAGVTFTSAGLGTVSIEAPVTGGAGRAVFVAGGTLRLRMDVGTVALQVNAGEGRFEATQNLASIHVATAGKATLVDMPAPIVLQTTSLTMAGSAKIDIADNGVIVTYTGLSPLPSILNAIASAYAGGAWTGPGIGSSAAVANSQSAIGYAESSQVASPSPFLGEGFSGNAVLVRWTLKGDANLDGTVGFDDLVALAQAYDVTNSTRAWINGDSNYDGIVNFDDLVPLAQNYNASISLQQAGILGDVGGEGFLADWALVQSLVPEPAALAALAGLCFIPRRATRLRQ